MKNVTINITFDSLEDLQEYLASQPSTATAKVASAQPSAEVVQMPAAAPAAEEVEEVDLVALKSDLMNKLRELSSGLDDPAPIAAFIHSFGVQKFSDLPDEQLVSFEASLKDQFGV